MTDSRGNIFDYLEWRGDLSFRQSAFNVVDALIFAVFAYINYHPFGDAEKPFHEVVDELEKVPEEERFKGIGIIRENSFRLISRAAATARFRDVRICQYVDKFCEKNEKQFAAMSFLLPDGSLCMAYRGTDNSLIGWKEDINMSFLNGTPAQLEATEYARMIAEKYPDMPIHMTGHSKGGNLAVWAGAHLPAEVQARVMHVYNNDGPGFRKEFIESDEYRSIAEKVLSFVPESSIVGVLMVHSDYLIIKSTNLTVMQHDPFSWVVIGKRFEYDLERSHSGKLLEKSINSLFESMTPAELEVFAEKIYAVLRSTKATKLEDLEKNLFQHLFFTLPKIIREASKTIPKQS